MKNLWFIAPLNEGQELNYGETFKGSLERAKSRAIEIATGLQKILKDGLISVEILDKNLDRVFLYHG